MRVSCAEHPLKPPAYRCDGCERLLCEECVQTGHRLLFCRHCGERALPLEGDTPANTRDVAQHLMRTAPYSLREAFGYPLRGLGGYVFWGTFALLGSFMVLEVAAPFVSLLVLAPRLLIALLTPSFLIAIVRSTAEGNNELPDWPDWFDGERSRELLSAIAIGGYLVLPAMGLVSIAGCGVDDLLGGNLGCWVLIALGLALGLLIWVPAFAAIAAFGAGLLSVRLDLHARALQATFPETVRVAAITLGLALAGEALGLVLSAVPLLGSLANLWIGLYALMVGTHLIGLLLRKHEADLEPIYCH